MGHKPRLSILHREIADCRICEADLPLGPRPVVQFSRRSAVAIVGQAPGTKVHATGVPWDDDSGDHLRDWLGVDRDAFYNPDRFALIPMGFCYPGQASGGDAPPRPECAPQWHDRIWASMGRRPLLVLCGMYAQRHYLGAERRKTLGETVSGWRGYLPAAIPLPHPSWRSKLWMAKNPWFAAELLPELRRLVARLA